MPGFDASALSSCAGARAVLATPLERVLDAVQRLPAPKHGRPASSGVGNHDGLPPRVVTLDHNATVSDALEVLARHRILSAPVVIQPDVLRADDIHHERLDADERREAPTLLGFFDVGDALRCLVDELPAEDRVAEPEGHPHRNVLAWMKILEVIERRVSRRRLIGVTGDDAELMYRGNLASHALGDVVRDGFLGNRSADGVVHRVAIFDTHGEISRVVSMSDAVRFIASRADDLGAFADASLTALGLVRAAEEKEDAERAEAEREASAKHPSASSSKARKPPKARRRRLVTVPPTLPAMEAFAKMRDEGVSAVGVMDDRGEALIANLSASDVRGIQPEHFGVLGLPAAEFLALLHGTAYAGFSRAHSASASNPFFAGMNEGGFRRHGPFLVTVTPETTLAETLRVIVERGVHRVYACERRPGEDFERPVDVVTLTDILRRVCEAAEEAK